MNSKIKLPNMPLATSICNFEDCAYPNKKIIFYKYKIDSNGIRMLRSIPRYHAGHCKEMGALGYATKRITKYKNRKKLYNM